MYTEVKLMDLAARVFEMDANDHIDFVNGDEYTASMYGGWCGIRKLTDYFDNCNQMYLIGHYGCGASPRMYSLSEWDNYIGNDYWKLAKGDFPTELEKVSLIARAIADYMDCEFGERICETMTIDEEV